MISKTIGFRGTLFSDTPIQYRISPPLPGSCCFFTAVCRSPGACLVQLGRAERRRYEEALRHAAVTVAATGGLGLGGASIGKTIGKP